MEIENLNKENFFNELTEKYPIAMKIFCDWIDEYKKEVDWDYLFNEGEVKGDFKSAPKFHDLPYDMQSGIIIRFACEHFKDTDNAYIGVKEMKELFSSCIGELNQK